MFYKTTNGRRSITLTTPVIWERGYQYIAYMKMQNNNIIVDKEFRGNFHLKRGELSVLFQRSPLKNE